MTAAPTPSSYQLRKQSEASESARLMTEYQDRKEAERASTVARASTEPLAVDFRTFDFGPGIGNQPSHDALLRESMGPSARNTRAIANRVSSLEWQVTDIVTGDLLPTNALQVLLDKPHPDLSKAQLLQLTTQHIVTVGEAYWLKVGSGLKVPVELHPIDPRAITPRIQGGVTTGYRVNQAAGGGRILAADEVIRFYFPDPENLFGSEGYLGPAGVTADSLKYSGQHLREHFRWDATPSSVLETVVGGTKPFEPGSDQDKRFKNLWQNAYHRIMGASRGVPVQLPEGLKLIQLALQSGADITPLLEYWSEQQQMDFGVPRSILGNSIAGDRSTAETNQYVFDRYTVTPVASLIDQTVTLQLAPDFDDRLVASFVPFVSADKDFELKKRKQRIELREISVDDAREEDGDPPQPWGGLPVGTFADQPYTGQTSSGSAGRSRSRAREEDPLAEREITPIMRLCFARQENVVEKFGQPFIRELRKIFKDQRDETIRRFLEKVPRARIEAGDIFNPDDWTEDYEENVEPLRAAAFVAIATGTLADLSEEAFVFKESVKKAIERQGAMMIQQIGQTTKDDIARQLFAAAEAGESSGQVVKRIRTVFTQATEGRARAIAKTEIGKASSAAQLEGFEQSGVVEENQWNHSLNPQGRDNHIPMDGVTTIVGVPFQIPAGETAQAELADAPRIGAGGVPLSAGNSVNCECFLTPVFTRT